MSGLPQRPRAESLGELTVVYRGAAIGRLLLQKLPILAECLQHQSFRSTAHRVNNHRTIPRTYHTRRSRPIPALPCMLPPLSKVPGTIDCGGRSEQGRSNSSNISI